jgi:taurine dioxygenase
MATASQVTPDLTFEPVTGVIGAWVRNFELGAADNQLLAERLRRELAEHGVLFFDLGRVPDSREFEDFASLFGKVQPKFGQVVKDRDENAPPFIDSDRTPMKPNRINVWHGDGGPLAVPPLAAILTAYEVPEAGGDTMWASMVAAYDALSPHMQRMLDGMKILNNNSRLPFLEPREHIQPAVVVNPITGRKCLFVDPNYTERFLDVPEAENRALLQFLAEHINTPEFHVRLRWQPGYAAVWHQQVTKHRGVDDFTGPRKLQRHTVDGEPLIGPNDKWGESA